MAGKEWGESRREGEGKGKEGQTSKPRVYKDGSNCYLLYNYNKKRSLNIILVRGVNLNFEGTTELKKKKKNAEGLNSNPYLSTYQLPVLREPLNPTVEELH